MLLSKKQTTKKAAKKRLWDDPVVKARLRSKEPLCPEKVERGRQMLERMKFDDTEFFP